MKLQMSKQLISFMTPVIDFKARIDCSDEGEVGFAAEVGNVAKIDVGSATAVDSASVTAVDDAAATSVDDAAATEVDVAAAAEVDV